MLSVRLTLLTPPSASHGGDGDGVNKVPAVFTREWRWRRRRSWSLFTRDLAKR